MMVYVIEVDEDGDIRVTGMTEELFLLELHSGPIDPRKLRTDILEKDPMSWGDKSILAIKGEIVTIRPVSQVTEWEIE